MSLLEYDIIDNKIDKNKTWIDIPKQVLFSREIINRYRYYSLACKYNNEKSDYDYFIIHSIDKMNGSKVLEFDNYGRAKIKINSIFKSLGFKQDDKNSNVNIKLIENEKDYDVYLIEC